MNALQNMECVRNGSSSLKEQTLVALGDFLSQAKSKTTNPKFLAQADQQIADLMAKAESLPDEFFAGIDCPWEGSGKAILAAVLKA